MDDTQMLDPGSRSRIQDPDPGSRIQIQDPDPGSGFRIQIQDPGSRIQIRDPDPGSRSRIQIQDPDPGSRIRIHPDPGSGSRIRIHPARPKFVYSAACASCIRHARTFSPNTLRKIKFFYWRVCLFSPDTLRLRRIHYVAEYTIVYSALRFFKWRSVF